MPVRTGRKKEVQTIKHHRVHRMKITILEMYYRGLHTHKDVEVIQLLTGVLHIMTPDEDFYLYPGDMAYFNPNQPHSCQTETINGSSLFVIQFDPALCTEYYPAMRNLFFESGQMHKYIPEQIMQELKAVSRQVGWEYFSQEKGYEFACVGAVNHIMSCMLKYMPYQLISEEEYLASSHYNKRMDRIIMYVQDHFSEKISLQEIAKNEGITTSYLSHLFRDYLQKSFQDYVNELRFERAVFLLKNTNMKVLDICIESGFSDSKYLNRTFIKTFGMTPKEFRREHQSLEHEREALYKNKGEFVYSDEMCRELLSR